ncbi:MAG TPA: methyltransferase [Planctomycetota bacterium]|nr:methyltransferase [Planctomycetota bacterium]
MNAGKKKLILVVVGNLANPVLALMWAFFAVSTYMSWRQTHSIVALLLFFVNTLFAVLFVLRRSSLDVSENPKDWMITAATILLSLSLRVNGTHQIALLAVSQAVQGVSVTIILLSLTALGRSFGLIPANRGVKTGGMYSYVRHPLYAGELLFYLGFIIGNFTAFNAVVCVCILLGLNVRAAAEERLLRKDDAYSHYMEHVRFRFFPGLY